MSLSNTEQPVLAGELSLVEIATLMVRHFKMHEGLFDPSFKVQVAVGHIGGIPARPDGGEETQGSAAMAYPGALMTIQGLALNRVLVAGPHTVDASVVNPAPKEKPVESPRRANKAALRAKNKA